MQSEFTLVDALEDSDEDDAAEIEAVRRTLPPGSVRKLEMLPGGVLAEKGISLSPTNLTHLRAWDAVRRVCVEELTSPTSVFTSIVTPTIAINVLGFFGCYVYILYRIVFNREPFGSFTTSFTLFAATMLIYLFLILVAGHLAWKRLQAHTVAIARLSFDVSRQLDRNLHTNINSGTTMNNLLLPNSSTLLSSLTSMRTYLVHNQKNMRILGFGFGSMKYAAVFFLLGNGNVLFFALMIAVRAGMCGEHKTPIGPSPAPTVNPGG